MTPTRKLTDKRGNITLGHKGYDDVTRLNAIIRRLEGAIIVAPGVRAVLDDQILDATEQQGQGKGSGVSDPTGAQAGRIEAIQHQHRALTRAIRSIEEAVEHYRVESERALGKYDANPDDIANAKRCRKMVLLQQTVQLDQGPLPDEILVPCLHLTAHRLDDNGLPIGYDPEGFCVQHRAEADEAARRAADSNARRGRRFRTVTAGR